MIDLSLPASCAVSFDPTSLGAFARCYEHRTGQCADALVFHRFEGRIDGGDIVNGWLAGRFLVELSRELGLELVAAGRPMFIPHHTDKSFLKRIASVHSFDEALRIAEEEASIAMVAKMRSPSL